MKNKLLSYKDVYYITKTTLVEFVRDHSLNHGAALGYYMVLALVPMVYLAVEISAQIVGDRLYMVEAIERTLGDSIGIDSAHNLAQYLEQISFSEAKLVSKIIGVGALLFTSTAIFMALKRSINHFWNLNPVREKIVVRSLLYRLLSFGFLLLIGLLIIASYFIQVAFASVGEYFEREFSQSLQWSFGLMTQILSIGTNVILFSFIFKYLHDGVIKWKLAIGGALFTAILMFLGQSLLRVYMGNMYFSGQFGLGGTFLMVLTYVFYASQIVFLGAKFTYVYAKVSGNPIRQRR